MRSGPERGEKRPRSETEAIASREKENGSSNLGRKRYNFNAPVDGFRERFVDPEPVKRRAVAQPNPSAVLVTADPNVIANQDRTRVLNIKTPTKPTLKTSRKYSPHNGVTNQSSDDNIFWAVTPVDTNKIQKTNMNNVQNNISSSSVPSSPLKEENTNNTTLLNPKLQTLIEKYNSPYPDSTDVNNTATTPDIKRSVSDPSSLERLGSGSRYPDGSVPIIATKQTLSESMISSINKLKNSKRLHSSNNSSNHFLKGIGKNSTPDNTCKRNVSQLLLMIGKNLTGEEQNGNEKSINESDLNVALNETISNIPSSPNVDKQFQQFSDEDDDEFSFGDDEEELKELNNVLKGTEEEQEEKIEKEKVETKTANDYSSDEFSDDDDEEIEKLLTQFDKNDDSKDKSQARPLPTYKDMKLEFIGKSRSNMDSNRNWSKSNIIRENFNRFQINKITTTKYPNTNGKFKEQVILNVTCSDGTIKNLVVRDQWMDLKYQEGDIIHILGENQNLVDNANGVLVWNPDILLSATAISDSVDCPRKAVLNSRLSGPGVHVLPMTVGNIVHSVFQSCLSNDTFEDDYIEEIVDELIDSHFIEILSIGLTKVAIKEIIMQHVEYIKEWSKTYLVSQQKGSSLLSNVKKSNLELKVSNILDVEENIWSPMFGLRGLVDVVIEARLNDGSKYVVPMEIKTGREYITNRAQVSLYTYLLKDRYDVDTNNIVLVYTKQKTSYFDQPSTRDLKLLMNIRNKLSHYLRYGERELPPLKQNLQSCERCPLVTECITTNLLMEDGKFEDTGISKEFYDRLTEDIIDKPNYQNFYNHWDSLISKEEGLMNSMKRELWVMTSKEREASGGKGVGNLEVIEWKEIKAGRFHYVFQRNLEIDKKSLLNSQLSKHDRIILSDENGAFGLAFGFIESLTPNTIVISTDRKWANAQVKKKGFNSSSNQTFESVLSLGKNGDNANHISDHVKDKRYRIDKDEMFHGLALARFNILNLFISETGDFKRRKLIVDLEKPKFSKNLKIPYKLPDNHEFNIDQIKAFEKVMKTEDYSLILGMPGTGKTTVIAQLIKFLVANDKSVLLASYTHSAVDNILIKLIDDRDTPKILRAGSSPSSVHPLIRKFVINSESSEYKIETKEDFEKAFMEPQIVATTCLGIRDTVFIHRQKFDYCIIDEASQVSMPLCLGPLRFCDKFVLVGDHYQLPPLVLHPEAKNGGLDKSLFKILNDKYPQSVVELTHQYRMCDDIMLLSNILIYNGRLKSGSEKVSSQVFKIPFKERLDELINLEELNDDDDNNNNNKWMDKIFEEQNKVIFLNHDEIPGAREVSNGDKIENPIEAELIVQIIKSLIHCGVDQESIGVMSFYKAQLRHFYRSLSSTLNKIEVLTADRFQGRDKDCIIISLVRSNQSNLAGDLLKEWRRINVAMTRAKSKLIILGSKKMMQNIEQFEGFMHLIETKGWLYDLPSNADKLYTSIFQFSNELSHLSISPQRKIKKSISPNSKVFKKTSIIKNIIDENS